MYLGLARLPLPQNRHRPPAAAATNPTTAWSFHLNSDTGDGVGDDVFSYGYDVSTNLEENL